MSRRRAFTLIELLVVVAIITVLVSLLIPSLGRARSAAKRAVCLSNVRQLNMGLHQYGSEQSDYLPAFSTYDSTPTFVKNWTVDVFGELGNQTKPFVCPGEDFSLDLTHIGSYRPAGSTYTYKTYLSYTAVGHAPQWEPGDRHGTSAMSTGSNPVGSGLGMGPGWSKKFTACRSEAIVLMDYDRYFGGGRSLNHAGFGTSSVDASLRQYWFGNHDDQFLNVSYMDGSAATLSLNDIRGDAKNYTTVASPGESYNMAGYVIAMDNNYLPRNLNPDPQ